MLAAKLDRLVAAFEAHGYSVSQNLRAGVSEGRLDELAARLGVSLPEPFRDLYRWRNGHVDPDASNVLRFRDNTFLRLEDIPQARDNLLTYAPAWNDPDLIMPGIDPFSCVPIAEFMGAIDALVCGPQRVTDRSPHPIMNFFHGVDLVYHSIDSMIDTCIEWVEQPDYRHDRESSNELEIWLRHNPGLFGPPGTS